jgi:SAM-dependent methyltransferase
VARRRIDVRRRRAPAATEPYPAWVAYEPTLVPPPELMAWEGIDVLEEWFRWGEEWSMLLRAYAGLGSSSAVLEIGCGLGRIAFPLRYILDARGTYDGFEIVKQKIDWLGSTFTPAHPNFRFTWANVRNTHYNPAGEAAASEYRFPYDDGSFDVVFAASVFTHLAPENAAHYVAEASRVLRPGGRCLFSFFLLDNYRPASERPHAFARPDFDFAATGMDEFASADPDDPERMTAYRRSLVERLASDAGLRLSREPLAGFWSGSAATWVCAQDLVALENDAC